MNVEITNLQVRLFKQEFFSAILYATTVVGGFTTGSD